MKTEVTITTPDPDQEGALIVDVIGEDGTQFRHQIVDKVARAALEKVHKEKPPKKGRGRRAKLNFKP